MSDMLVKLYELPEIESSIQDLKQKNIFIRRLSPADTPLVEDWVCQNFPQWSNACTSGAYQSPSKCFIAIESLPDPEKEKGTYHSLINKVVGFACYDVAAKGMFGPMAVQKNYQNKGIGRALLLKCLKEMYNENYAYATIGWVVSEEYYSKAVSAIPIKSSEPGIFLNKLVSGE